MIDSDRGRLVQSQERVKGFLEDHLKLNLHGKNNILVRAKDGMRFLGVMLYPAGRRLNNRNRRRILERLNVRNAGSYSGMVKQFEKKKYLKRFQWELVEKFLM